MRNIYLLLLLLTASCMTAGAQTAADYAVQLNAATQSSPARIQLQWKKLSGATGYTISRKGKYDGGFTTLATLSATDSFYNDLTVVADSAYEYRVLKTGTIQATGYIFAAIAAPPMHTRGYCVLVVDTLMRDSCKAEVRRLMEDLRGDGWGLIRHDVARTVLPATVRGMIQADYAAQSNVQAVLLVGHVAVPYSGDINPDGHTDHLGAWPADVYYGDIDGNWLDVSVTDTLASRAQNRNKPGDGRWDESTLPSLAELAVGRIDFAGMPAIARSEVQLMRNYLNKAHSYKMDSIAILRKGVVDDNFGAFSGEAFAANAWRAFPVMIGRNNISTSDFQTVLKDSAYQWAYACGAGGYNSCSGVGVTADFSTKPVKGIFTMAFGSYFGDWDAPNSFLKAPLCATEPALTNCWAGRPNWFMHHMALGESIGYSTRLSQNNSGLYGPTNYGATMIHTALMGDLSLRTDYIRQPSGFHATAVTGTGAALSWTASPDPDVIGYYVYRSDDAWGSYGRISGLITATSFTDTRGTSGMKYYLLRPVKLVSNPSGAYYNLGVGVLDSANVIYPVHVVNVAALTELVVFPNPAASQLFAEATATAPAAATYRLLDATGRAVAEGMLQLRAGTNRLSWDVSRFADGFYTLQIRSQGTWVSKKWVKASPR